MFGQTLQTKEVGNFCVVMSLRLDSTFILLGLQRYLATYIANLVATIAGSAVLRLLFGRWYDRLDADDHHLVTYLFNFCVIIRTLPFFIWKWVLVVQLVAAVGTFIRLEKYERQQVPSKGTSLTGVLTMLVTGLALLYGRS